MTETTSEKLDELNAQASAIADSAGLTVTVELSATTDPEQLYLITVGTVSGGWHTEFECSFRDAWLFMSGVSAGALGNTS